MYDYIENSIIQSPHEMYVVTEPSQILLNHFGLTYTEIQINTYHQSCLSPWQTVTADCMFQWKVGKQKLLN